MKGLLKATGKAVLYFLVYYGAQLLMFGIIGVTVSTQLTMEAMAQGQEPDYMVYYERYMARVMELSTLVVLMSGILTMFIYWLTFVIRKKKFLTEVAFRRMDVRGILPVFLIGMSFCIVASVLIAVIPFPQSWVDSYAVRSSNLAGGNAVINWIAIVFAAPVVEEVVFRGLVYTRLKKGMPAAAAAILSSLLFGAVHGTVIWFCYTFVFALLLVWFYEKFQSLAANILFHMSFNLTGQVFSGITEISDAAMWAITAAAVMLMAAMMVFIWKRFGRQETEGSYV